MSSLARRLDLLVQRHPEIGTCHRTCFRAAVHRIADDRSFHRRDESFLKTVGNRIFDDKPFCRNTALPGVDPSALRRVNGHVLNRGVGIVAAEYSPTVFPVPGSMALICFRIVVAAATERTLSP